MRISDWSSDVCPSDLLSLSAKAEMADQQAVVERHPRDGAQPARKAGDPDGHDPARHHHCQQGDDLILNYAVPAQQPYARIKQEQPYCLAVPDVDVRRCAPVQHPIADEKVKLLVAMSDEIADPHRTDRYG